ALYKVSILEGELHDDAAQSGGDRAAVLYSALCREPGLSGELGISRLGILLLALILSALVFAGSQIFPFFYYYHELQGMMEAQAKKASVFSDQEMREVLMESIRKLEIPVESPDDLKINRVNDKIIIELEYDEVFFIDLGEDRVYDLHVFHFNPRVEAPL
ncbi:MAG: hypothetical protein KDD69_19835, partial [Bdellovibrionales bacterium]|nr:hypothetical protein [Bdellovibrionales bacterium]